MAETKNPTQISLDTKLIITNFGKVYLAENSGKLSSPETKGDQFTAGELVQGKFCFCAQAGSAGASLKDKKGLVVLSQACLEDGPEGLEWQDGDVETFVSVAELLASQGFELVP